MIVCDWILSAVGRDVRLEEAAVGVLAVGEQERDVRELEDAGLGRRVVGVSLVAVGECGDVGIFARVVGAEQGGVAGRREGGVDQGGQGGLQAEAVHPLHGGFILVISRRSDLPEGASSVRRKDARHGAAANGPTHPNRSGPADRVSIHAVPGGHPFIQRGAGGSRPIQGDRDDDEATRERRSEEDRPGIQASQSWVSAEMGWWTIRNPFRSDAYSRHHAEPIPWAGIAMATRPGLSPDGCGAAVIKPRLDQPVNRELRLNREIPKPGDGQAARRRSVAPS